MRILLKNGRVLDPANRVDARLDVLIEDGRIARLDAGIDAPADETIDVSGKLVVPGFVDMHVHLREPGREDKETIGSGTRAAAAGGFTSVCPMPNTTPVVDSAQGIKFLLARSQTDAVVNVFPVAAVTIGQEGKAITEFGDLVYYGAVAFSDDGNPVMDAEVMRRALEYTSMFSVPILDHCDDLSLSAGGQMRSGEYSSRLGLKGIPSAAETTQVARDIDLAEYTGGHIHICHVSVPKSLEYIRRAKEDGIHVTCEVTPHHLTLTEESLVTYDTNFKMAPPLGSEEARQALVEGLRDGTIDCIATDHAPHTDMDKDQVLADAPFGVIGMESAFPVLYTDLVLPGCIDLPMLIEKMTVAPARIIHQDKGTLSVAADADIAVIDLDAEYAIDVSRFESRSRNCPFNGKTVRGRIDLTIVGGRVVYRDGRICV